MKRKISGIIFCIMALVLAFGVTAFAQSLGDIDGNGKITAADSRLTLRHAARLDELSEEQQKVADVDKNGKITSADARLILRVAAKIDVPFEGLAIDELLAEAGVLNVAVPVENAPFAYTEDGTLKGFDIEAAEALAETTKLTLKLHPMSYEECIEAVKNGTCDLMTGVDVKYSMKEPEGTYRTVVYFDCYLSCVASSASPINTVADVRNNSKLVVGLIENSHGSTYAKAVYGDGVYRYYKTCADAVVALENGAVDVLIAEDTLAIHTTNANGGVKSVRDDIYSAVSLAMVASSPELAEKLQGYAKGINTGVNENSSVSVSQSKLTMCPGSIACIEVTAESFFTAEPDISVSTSNCKAFKKQINGKTYVFVTAHTGITGKGLVSVQLWAGSQVYSADIDVELTSAGPAYYQYFDGVKIPDFGAFTKTKPYETTVDIENQAIVHTYSVEDLYYNGVTDASVLDAYLQSIIDAGFDYYGYQEYDNAITYLFGDEEAERAVTYVEVYDEDGYIISIGVGYNFPDYMN